MNLDNLMNILFISVLSSLRLVYLYLFRVNCGTFLIPLTPPAHA